MLRSPLTIAQAVEGAAGSGHTGYRFVGPGAAESFVSYAEVEHESARRGAALQALGVQRGDRVALLLSDQREFVLAFLGTIRAGAIPVPVALPTGLGRSERYLESALGIIAQSTARWVLGDARLVADLEDRCPTVHHFVTPAALDQGAAPLRPAAVTLDDVCCLQFSSGSTGRPRGVTLRHANVAANTSAMVGVLQHGLGLGDGEGEAASWLPLYHDMGLIGCVLAPLYHRFTVTLLAPSTFLRRPVRWLEVMSRFRVDMSFAPSSGYGHCVGRVRDAELDGLDLSGWRVAGCGAEPISVPTLRAFARRFAAVGFDERAFLGCYGLAESTLAVSFSACAGGLTVDEHQGAALAACGPAFPGHELAVFALDDEASRRPLPERREGEIRVRGPSVAAGYWDDPAATAAAFAGDWLRTGDLGYVADGQLYVCGRSKEAIIVHGRNHYPQDLEWAAGQVPGVRADGAIAFGVRDPDQDSDRVQLLFETRGRDAPDVAALVRAVGIAVAGATGLALDAVIPVAPGSLPRTTSGKLQRLLTRQLYEAGQLRGLSAAPPRVPADEPDPDPRPAVTSAGRPPGRPARS